MRAGDLTPPVLPAGEDDSVPVEERIEARFGLGGKSLNLRAARGALINAAFQVGLAGVGLLKRVGVAAFLTVSEYGIWGILVTTLITLGWLKQIGISDKYVQQDERDQELAFQKAFTLELAYSILFYGFVIVALPIYALAYDQPEILLPGLILSLSLLATALQTPIWIAYRQMRFFRQRSLESIDPVLSAVVTLVVGGSGPRLLEPGDRGRGRRLRGRGRRRPDLPYPLAWRFDRGSLRDYFGFSWPLFVAGLSGILVVQGSVLVGSYTVGLVGLGAARDRQHLCGLRRPG